MHWAEDDVVVEGVRLHIARAGRGGPVLLLHGVSENGRCWGRTAEALARDHEVLLLDQRAQGRSEAPASGYGLADFAGDAAGIIRGLGVVPASVMGHSLGARVALTLAASYPDLVARLVLEDPPLVSGFSAPDQPEVDPDQARHDWFEWLRALRALSQDDLVARCRADSPAWSAEECLRWAESKLQVAPRLWGPGGVQLASPWRQEMTRVRCPTLLVRGDVALGSVVDDAHAAEIVCLLPDGHDAHIEGAGHSIHRDQFGAFVAAVGPFLDPPRPA